MPEGLVGKVVAVGYAYDSKRAEIRLRGIPVPPATQPPFPGERWFVVPTEATREIMAVALAALSMKVQVWATLEAYDEYRTLIHLSVTDLQVPGMIG